MNFIIYPPENAVFFECEQCKNPAIKPIEDNSIERRCLYCQINSLPTKTGLYNVENQYNQTGISFWDGDKWGEWSGVKGNCMHYGDAYIVKYEYIGESENEPDN
jgi:hypothetical protein